MKYLLFLVIAPALLSGILPLFLQQWQKASKFCTFLLLGISGVSAIGIGAFTLITHNIFLAQINTTIPSIVWQFTLDPLAGFFLAVVGIVVFSVAIYAPGYVRNYAKNRPITSMSFFTSLFVIGMYLVLIAHDVFSFMLSWELMSIASYFLVIYNHEHANNRKAALLYLLMAQTSGLLILGAFGILAKFSASLGFAALATATVPTTYMLVAFLMAFLGFGMKAGIVPLHVWLPEAHPVAPSHISALMSGVMLKVAIYGFIRFSFDLLHNMHWQGSGIIVLVSGVISALLGILYALMQHDLKKLLAYSSVENIGIIFIGLGLALIFLHTKHPLLAALGLIAALYHCLNHALFKSLLFLGAGAILQQSHEHDLEHMGGLIKKMPYTAVFFLIGCSSIVALPPLNGFVSEWLTFQTALQAFTLSSPVLRTLIPVAVALLALTSTLAAACFVKVYGVAFLGQARTRNVRRARDPKFGMLIAMGFLAFLCILFGVLPVVTISALNTIPLTLLGTGLTNTNNWLWLTPLAPTTASYSAPLVSIAIVVIALLTFGCLHLFWNKVKRRVSPPWDCGFGGINSRMQYSATAFAMPLRRVFHDAWPITEKIERTSKHINYSLQVGDWLWKYIYEPLAKGVIILAHKFARLQGGNIRVYLAYTFIILIFLLWVIT